LVVIAFEDIGAGDVDVLLEIVFVAQNREWRRASGEAAVLGAVVGRLAEATKDRSADYLACAARDHPDLSEICDFCRKVSLDERLRLLADTSLPLAKRAVAAWFASGINWRYDQQVRGGDIRALAGAYRELGAGEELANSMVLAAKRAPEPLVVLALLIWLEVQRSGPATTRNGPVPPTKSIAGVPLYAFDKHTRIGKRAIERLVRENKPLRDCIVRFLAKGSPKQAAEIAALIWQCPNFYFWPRNEPGLTAGQPHQARLTQWRLAFPVRLGGLPGEPLRIVAMPRKKTKPVMWAGRLGWPPHPCPCRSALQKLKPKIALRFRPHVAALR
jgi:hypothetical protein